MENNLKEVLTGKNYYWIAKTKSGMILMRNGTIDLKSFRKDKEKKIQVEDFFTVASTGKEDMEALQRLKNDLKKSKGFSDNQINRLTFECIPKKELNGKPTVKENLNKILEQKQLRLDIDDNTANLACDILYYFEQIGEFQLKESLDTIDIFDPNNEEQICQILFWNKKYSIFVPDSSYYYIGRTLEEFEKDFDEIYENYAKDLYGYFTYENEIDGSLKEYYKGKKYLKIKWVDNLEDANKLCPKKYWKYFDDATIPKFLTDKDMPGKKYGFVIDTKGRPLAGIAAYFNGKKDSDYKDETLPYLWELGAVSKEPENKTQEPCPWARARTGSMLANDFAKKVNYKFWFSTASDSANKYWIGLVSKGYLNGVSHLYYLGNTKWNDPAYSTVKPNIKLCNFPNKDDRLKIGEDAIPKVQILLKEDAWLEKKEGIIEILIDGKWEGVGNDRTKKCQWSIDVPSRIFKNGKEAKTSGLYHRLLNAGYSEEKENIRFNSQNKLD